MMDADDQAAHLLTGVAWQDSLLQGYRSLHLTLQAIFLAIATGLVIAVLSFSEPFQLWLTAASFTAFFFLGIGSLWHFSRLILARGKDVDFWQRELLIVERGTEPESRLFQKFKDRQERHRSDNADPLKFLPGETLSETDLDILMGRGLGHTRKIIDIWLSRGLGVTWLLLAVVMTVALFSGL